MALIRRKTIAIKSDNVSDVLMSNIGSISESVANFQQMSEQSGENDIALQFQNQKDNYEKEVAKLTSRVEKQKQRQDELKSLVSTLTAEVEQLDYERGQYKEKIDEVTAEVDQVDA